LSRHVPPTDAAFSKTTKSVAPVCRRRWPSETGEAADDGDVGGFVRAVMTVMAGRAEGNVRAFIRVSPIWLILNVTLVDVTIEA
jgi:hypothetical protein